MNTSNHYDSIEQLIFESGLKIADINSNKNQNRLMVFLNSGALLSFPISDYKLLTNATQEQLMNYRIDSSGVGVHWPDLDEDLSLKGFLKDELRKLAIRKDKKNTNDTSYTMAL